MSGSSASQRRELYAKKGLSRLQYQISSDAVLALGSSNWRVYHQHKKLTISYTKSLHWALLKLDHILSVQKMSNQAASQLRRTKQPSCIRQVTKAVIFRSACSTQRQRQNKTAFTERILGMSTQTVRVRHFTSRAKRTPVLFI